MARTQLLLEARSAGDDRGGKAKAMFAALDGTGGLCGGAADWCVVVVASAGSGSRGGGVRLREARLAGRRNSIHW